jgi:hypothetical protein
MLATKFLNLDNTNIRFLNGIFLKGAKTSLEKISKVLRVLPTFIIIEAIERFPHALKKNHIQSKIPPCFLNPCAIPCAL